MERSDPVAERSRLDLSSLPPDGGERYNRLIFEKSPYLLQHAENPIDWYPWGEEAFSKAVDKQCPVFLSIGYSTCHWCHVMEQESFESDAVAEVLNRAFVAIKVDREERPDIDGTYMAVCQMMNGMGGWPLNLILTPQRVPFFAATYLPPASRGEMIGLIPLLEKVEELWRRDPTKLTATADQVEGALRKIRPPRANGAQLGEDPLERAFRQFCLTFDKQHSGFGDAPKFPLPHNLSLLMRLWYRTGDATALNMALATLRAIRMGGVYDQLGGGVHRYAVDSAWGVPHFEKMLYDQALLSMAFLEAYQASDDPFFSRAVRETLEYVHRDLGHPEGGFYCGEDADTEGREGTFYLWSLQEIKELLGEETGSLFARCFDVTEKGNFEGSNILRKKAPLAALAEELGQSEEELRKRLDRARLHLFEARGARPRPHRDDKIVTGWNGLAIAAFARAGAVLQAPHLIFEARRAADFLLSRLRTEEGRLLRSYRRGRGKTPGFLEDYAFLTLGLSELFLADGTPRYLQVALELTRRMVELFSGEGEAFYDTGHDAETVLVRAQNLQDGAVPAGNSVAALNLLRLGRLSADRELEERGRKILQGLSGLAEKHPTAFGQLLIAHDFALGPVSELVIVSGRPRGDEGALLAAAHSRLLPRTLVLKAGEGMERLAELAPLCRGKAPSGDRATAFLCEEGACREPVSDPSALRAQLDVLARRS